MCIRDRYSIVYPNCKLLRQQSGVSSMTDTERSALLRCQLFVRIAPNDVFALTECLGAAERRYERGAPLWLTGDAVGACAVILSGLSLIHI